MVVTSLSTYNLDLLTLECLDESVKWKVKWVFTLCLPLLFLLPFAVVFCVGILFVKRSSKKEKSKAESAEVGDDLYAGDDDDAGGLTMAALVDAAKRAYFQLLVLLFLPLTSAALGYFACSKKAGSTHYRLDEARYVRCYDSAYYSLLPVAIVASLLYVLGIPAVVAALLFKKRASLSELDFALKYGFLVGRFKEAAFAYELAIMGRKVGVVLAMVLLRGVENKANAALLVLGGCLVHLALTLPYYAQLHNRLAIVCLSAVTMVLWGGTMESHDMSATIVICGILVNIIAMIGGAVLDWKRITDEEHGEGEEAFASVLDYEGAVVEQGDGERMASAQSSMGTGNSIALSILEDDQGMGGMNTVQVHDSVPISSGGVMGEELIPTPPPLSVPVDGDGDDDDDSSDSSSS